MEIINEYEKHTEESKRKVDECLRTSNEVPDAIFNAIRSSMAIDSEKEVDWAVGRIEVIYDRINHGGRMYIPSLQRELNKDTWGEIRDRYFQ